ncbi:MAG: UDP-N-acetylmuramoyl-L-alanine--D-glutamate ligase [Bacteroidia bacterium]|nr:UDP-N-acetylmuramoyl-L-alanine--D-glutamate ligase [Bacteroidia bacterium]
MNSINTILASRQKILIFGFGREGKSTYRYIRSRFPQKMLTIADEKSHPDLFSCLSADPYLMVQTEEKCFNNLSQFDLIIKTPGIPLFKLTGAHKEKITSQTDLFLRQYGAQTTGISGTKGKSTTASLIYHLLKVSGRDTIFAGNIGIPAFDMLPQITPETTVVMELSAHQGEILHAAPHVMILLNLFQEHLDHFGNFGNYKQAKLNFCTFQKPGDYFIYLTEDPELIQCAGTVDGVHYIGISESFSENGYSFKDEKITGRGLVMEKYICALKGKHNRKNIAAALAAAHILEINTDTLQTGLASFSPLKHRMEFVGEINTVKYYNDSISTVPEATIAAMETLNHVSVLILGGFDRGIDYSKLANYLRDYTAATLVLLGQAGKRMGVEFLKAGIPQHRMLHAASMEECFSIAHNKAPGKTICLLSPAAASYDSYADFEERGDHFKALVKQHQR